MRAIPYERRQTVERSEFKCNYQDWKLSSAGNVFGEMVSKHGWLENLVSEA